MNLTERKNRIIARGEVSGHSHIVVGDAIVRNERGEILIEITGTATIRHLLEKMWIDEEKEQWTGEHTDIDLTDLPVQIRHGDVFLDRITPNTYRFIQQKVFDPLSKRIEDAKD